MSKSSADPTFGNTITGGIQDVSALLPLIGTEQCENHVGSALERGLLYAAVTPVSIFGSLGIVKAGISILIANFTIYIPKFSLRLSGAKALHNAGFIPPGSVAPLIALDSEGGRDRRRRYQVENRFVTDRRIDDPEKHSIDHRTLEWNLCLVLSSVIVGAFGFIPYIAINVDLEDSHHYGVYPLLRIGGSVVACITCQFILQHRILYLIKNRLVFMSVDRLINPTDKTLGSEGKPGVDITQSQNAKATDAPGNDNGEEPSTDNPYGQPEITLSRRENINFKLLRPSDFVWDESLPSEECLGNLKQHLHSFSSIDIIAVKGETEPTRMRQDFLDELDRIHAKRFPSPKLDLCFFVLSWICLLLSLPATVIGYVGCFTLVSSSPEVQMLLLNGLGAKPRLLYFASFSGQWIHKLTSSTSSWDYRIN